MSTPTISPEDRAEQIRVIISQFDWRKVHDAMIALRWEWRGDGVPSIGALVNTATELLGQVNGESLCIRIGGFRAFIEDGKLGLEFVVDYFWTGDE